MKPKERDAGNDDAGEESKVMGVEAAGSTEAWDGWVLKDGGRTAGRKGTFQLVIKTCHRRPTP